MDSLIAKAEAYAVKAHQKRATTTVAGYCRPQQIHLQEVADLVWAAGGTDRQVAAAWLHDTVEDTPITVEEIRKEFGAEIAELVAGLTDPPEYRELPVAERKHRQLERLHSLGRDIRLVKLADQTANVRFFSLNPPADMSLKEVVAYVRGAEKLANLCAAESPLLYGLFMQAFHAAMRRTTSLDQSLRH